MERVDDTIVRHIKDGETGKRRRWRERERERGKVTLKLCLLAHEVKVGWLPTCTYHQRTTVHIERDEGQHSNKLKREREREFEKKCLVNSSSFFFFNILSGLEPGLLMTSSFFILTLEPGRPHHESHCNTVYIL